MSNGDSPRGLVFDGQADGHEQLGWLVPNHPHHAACHAGAMARGEAIQLIGEARVTALTRSPGRHGDAGRRPAVQRAAGGGG